MTVTLQMLLTVCPLVFFASCVDAIAGGGGLISLPAYYLAGLPPVLASGSNKFSACFGTLTATLKYLRGGKLLMLPALLAVPGALLGSAVGAELLKHAPERFVRVLMLVVIPVVAVLFLFGTKQGRTNASGRTGACESADERTATPGAIRYALGAKSLVGCLCIGLGCGFYDGFFGPGTGMFLIMLFTWCIGMDMVSASGTAKMVNLASNLAAMCSFLWSGQVLFALAVPAMLCSVLGGYVGARLALKQGAKFVRLVMMGVLALLLVKLAWDFFQGTP